MGGDQQRSSGSLAWLTLPRLLQLGTWSLFSKGMQQHCYQSSSNMYSLAQQYGQISGLHTTNYVGSLPGVAGHGVVNYSLHLVDPTTGVNTQKVESYWPWNSVKTKFKRMMGVSSAQLALHLDEFMWRKRHGKTASQVLNNVCADISTYIWKSGNTFVP